MTLNEKLETISELESVGLNENTIQSIVESIEHPEQLRSYSSVDALWNDLGIDEDNNETN